MLNPAFAKAHGISFPSDKAHIKNSHEVNSGTSNELHVKNQDIYNADPSQRIRHAIMNARANGKLNLSSIGLKNPLPNSIFNLRAGIEIDLSLDSHTSNYTASTFGEEEIYMLDLSDNDFSSVPKGGDQESRLDERITIYKALKTLRTRRCQLSTIPMIIFHALDNLQVLDLSGNNISHPFPLHLMPMSLRELNLSHNEITSLIDDENEVETLVERPYLVTIDISHNSLSTLPDQVKLASLQYFHFGNNKHVNHIPENIIKYSRALRVLHGSECNLTEAPNLSLCSKLTEIDFSDNSLQDVPSVHPNLSRFILTNNKIVSIQNMFRGIEEHNSSFRSNLVELHLRANRIHTLPSQIIVVLTNMTLLDLGSNDIKEIPYQLGYLPKLRKISLDGNPQRMIRLSLLENTVELKKSLRRRGDPPLGSDYILEEINHPSHANSGKNKSVEHKNAYAKQIINDALGGSHTLDLSKKQYDILPCEVLEELMQDIQERKFKSQIQNVQINHNKLKTLPSIWVEAFPDSLNTLDAGFNQIESLPKILSKRSFSVLHLNRNRLSSTAIQNCLGTFSPETIFFHSLLHLNLSSNGLEWVPDSLFHFSSLQTLHLGHNKISTLLESEDTRGWKVGLPSLENLDLSSNRIQDLGKLPSILGGCCSNLNTLLLNYNELKSIPLELGLLQSLHFIDLRGNPQRKIRSAILDRSCEAILEYLIGGLEAEELLKAKKAILDMKNMMEGKRLQIGLKKASASECCMNTAASIDHEEESRKEKKNESQNALTSALVELLRKEKSDLAFELNDGNFSSAKKYALKKKIAIVNAKLIKEERRLKSSS